MNGRFNNKSSNEGFSMVTFLILSPRTPEDTLTRVV